jgi:antitoxin (DNA-binding transcriptional repressor) of toxin-antitoxin stability system
MKAVAIKELKNRLSSYLREVRSGEVVLVTDRGRVVAELRRANGELPAASALDPALDRLEAEGLLERGLPQNARVYRPSPLRRPVATADLLDAEREGR